MHCQELKARVGYSTHPAAKEAGKELAARVLLPGEKPALAFLFATEEYNLEEVRAALLAAGPFPLLGACGAGVITPEGLLRKGVGVLTVFGEIEAVTACARLSPSPRAAGKRLAKKLLARGAKEGTVFLLLDGLAENLEEMLHSLYAAMGPCFQYVGGGTGDNLRPVKTSQLTEKGVASGAAAAALVSGCAFSIRAGHGWRPCGGPLVITRARGRTVQEIDRQPAASAYARRLGGVEPANFSLCGAKHPLGIADAEGKFVIRDPLEVLPDGSLKMVTGIPSKTIAYLMSAEPKDLLRTAREVLTGALQGIDSPRFALVFNCVSRLLFVGETAEAEIFREALGKTPFLGLLTFGEVAAQDSPPLLHNKTLVAAMGGERVAV